ncbi:MAG: hypothetical protein IKC46_12550 [Lachnospiraceae bacterium]|nr:hypothetical protein [Lachnospiraceae bacterium]
MAVFMAKGNKVTLTGDPTAHIYCVEIGGSVWRMNDKPYVQFADGKREEFPAPVSETCYDTGTSQSIQAVYTGFANRNITLRTRVELEQFSEDIFVTLLVEGEQKGEISYISFPAPFTFGAAYGDCGELTADNLPRSYTVLPRMQGVLIPAGQPIDIKDGMADGQIFQRDGYMPMFGQVRENTGYLAVYDTPFDVRYELRGEKVAALWDTSLGYMTYPRRMLFRFMENCDYNEIAHAYRTYVEQKGLLVTLKEKIAQNPNVAKLIGCPVIHSDIAKMISKDSEYYRPDDPEHNDWYVPFETRALQLERLHEMGLTKAYTHFDGWGLHGYDNLHPDPFPPHQKAGGFEGMAKLADTCERLGYIFGIHDQYRDFYFDAPTFDIEKAVTAADGSHTEIAFWEGGKQTFLCSAFQPAYVRRNYRIFEQQGVKIQASYLDVFSIVELDECFHPEHPVTRQQCAANRRECLDYLDSKGIIVSSEEPMDCILPSMALCHHAPFYTTSFFDNMSHAVGIPIPLFELVYHDCIIVPWIGDKYSRGGFGIPDTDSGYAYACLYGDPAYLPIDAKKEQMDRIMEVCKVSERYVFQQMKKHEFVTSDLRTQRTTFEDGTWIEVNFDTEEVTRSIEEETQKK